jgi:hypothetical protein
MRLIRLLLMRAGGYVASGAGESRQTVVRTEEKARRFWRAFHWRRSNRNFSYFS